MFLSNTHLFIIEEIARKQSEENLRLKAELLAQEAKIQEEKEKARKLAEEKLRAELKAKKEAEEKMARQKALSGKCPKLFFVVFFSPKLDLNSYYLCVCLTLIYCPFHWIGQRLNTVVSRFKKLQF